MILIKMNLIVFVMPLVLMGCLINIENKPNLKMEKWVKKEFKLYNKKLVIEFPKTKLFAEDITNPTKNKVYEFLVSMEYDNSLYMLPQFKVVLSMADISPTFFFDRDLGLQLKIFATKKSEGNPKETYEIINFSNGKMLKITVNAESSDHYLGRYRENYFKIYDENRVLIINIDFKDFITDDIEKLELRKKIALEIVSRIKVE